jgi:hypothetical protein
MPVKGVVFDYKTLLIQQGTSDAAQARGLLEWLHAQTLRVCVFSTEPLSAPQQTHFALLGYPPADIYIDKTDIPSRKNRGSPDWIDAAAQALAVARNELMYVGCTGLDWRTAINSGVLYLHARWAAPMPSGTTSLTAASPSEVREILKTFLLRPPRWSASLDGNGWKLRSLLPASAVLPSTSPGPRFRLQDVFTYDRTIRIGGNDARDVLMLFVLANAYLEGLLPPNLYLCVYPGSARGTVSEQLRGYLGHAAKLFHGYYRDDLLIRAFDAPDTSLARWHASQTGKPANVSIATQATTVNLGPSYRNKLKGKTVAVFDDFTTKGMSLQWARLLLAASGVRQAVLLTVGKYGTSHTRYELIPGTHINPYAANTALTPADFAAMSCTPTTDPDAPAYFHDIIAAMVGERDRAAEKR